MGREAFRAIYGPEEQARIARLVELVAPPQTRETALALPASVLAGVEVLISGWHGPTLDAVWLKRLPGLSAVMYGAGSVSSVMTAEAWQRGIVVTSAYEANAIPVAEYTLAMIILCLKHAWPLATAMRTRRERPGLEEVPGCFERVVGLVSLGAVGRAVARHLARLDVSVLAHDPHVAPAAAAELGVELASLESVFTRSDVVSVHAPHLRATERMITGAHLSTMKRGAAFINTSRGAVVCEDELIDVAARRGDLQFVLDVTRDEPPAQSSALYTLPNVLLTPHLAGSRGSECRRMGRCMVDELERYVSGAPLRWRITADTAHLTSHCPDGAEA
jgi:phosphoglycerate dehydrogenase-like enzyme